MAVGTLRQRTDKSGRALVSLAPYMPPSLHDQVLAVANSFERAMQAWTMVQLVPELSTKAVEIVYNRAKEEANDFIRLQLLAAVAALNSPGPSIDKKYILSELARCSQNIRRRDVLLQIANSSRLLLEVAGVDAAKKLIASTKEITTWYP
jgi:hypothetical protein